MPQSAGITAGTVADVIVVPYNDAAALERALSNRDVACFIVEPVMENIGICLPLPGYLEAVREITRRHGTLLIFDEVKTGITAGYGGATKALGVTPDLVCLAKSIGGGFPVGGTAAPAPAASRCGTPATLPRRAHRPRPRAGGTGRLPHPYGGRPPRVGGGAGTPR